MCGSVCGVGWLVVFNIPSTMRSFRDGAPIFCPLWRTWSSVYTPSPTGIEPRVVVWQSITQPLRHASSTCRWGHELKRSPGINRKSRVLYAGPSFLSSATCLFEKHYNGLIINQNLKVVWTTATILLIGNIQLIIHYTCRYSFKGKYISKNLNNQIWMILPKEMQSLNYM